MTRATPWAVVSLLVALAGPATTWAAVPKPLDVTIAFDEIGRGDHVLLTWKAVPGAVDYRTVWGPKSEPGTRSTHDTGGKTRFILPVEPGEPTVITVIARDQHGKEITRTKLGVLLPKGKVIGSAFLQVRGDFKQNTPTGTDHQTTHGLVHLQIYANPSLGKGRFEVYGIGEVKWKEVAVTRDGNFGGTATAPVFVKGVLRYPTDAEQETNVLCRLDLKLTEKFAGRVVHATGAVHGIPVHDFVMDWNVTKQIKAMLFRNNEVQKLAPGAAHNTYTVKLTDLNSDGIPGCTLKK